MQLFLGRDGDFCIARWGWRGSEYLFLLHPRRLGVAQSDVPIIPLRPAGVKRSDGVGPGGGARRMFLLFLREGCRSRSERCGSRGWTAFFGRRRA